MILGKLQIDIKPDVRTIFQIPQEMYYRADRTNTHSSIVFPWLHGSMIPIVFGGLRMIRKENCNSFGQGQIHIVKLYTLFSLDLYVESNLDDHEEVVFRFPSTFLASCCFVR